jgi:hypothetical protein
MPAEIADVAAAADRVRASTPEHRSRTGRVPRHRAVGMLSGETSRGADALLGLRGTTGVSLITVSDVFSERLAPLVAELSGR